ncbi:gas vesicle protein GvpC [Holdemanella biformis]
MKSFDERIAQAKKQYQQL